MEIHECNSYKSNGIDIFPRVLLITKNNVDEHDGASASLRNWFSEWPRNRLAHIYSAKRPAAEPFASHEYHLSGKDRRFGRVFDHLKGPFSRAASGIPEAQLATKGVPHRGLGTSAVVWASRLAVHSGLWELLFPPVLSDRLVNWIRAFAPDVVFWGGGAAGDISFVRLALAIGEQLKVPVCVHFCDDWPLHLYAHSFAAPLMRRLVSHAVADLVRVSALRLSTGERMSEEYRRRYGAEFEPLMICDDPERFRAAPPHRTAPDAIWSFAYCGSMGSRRCQPIAEFCEAARSLAAEGHLIELVVFSSAVPSEDVGQIQAQPNLRLCPAPLHEEVPSALKGADFLLLPEAFDPRFLSSICLSVSTKAHLYMMSERPILVYGPADAGVVRYAKQSGWAHVVDHQSKTALSDAIRRLITDHELSRSLVLRALEVASENHDAAVVRERLRAALLQASYSHRASQPQAGGQDR